MPAEVEPTELAQLLDTAERPRTANWSLRAALTRYAQPQPQRASEVIELVRRIEFALKPHAKLLERDGTAIWAALQSPPADPGVDDAMVALLRALTELDRLGDVLAAWAVDRAPDRPDALVDAVVADVAGRLERLGVRREEGPPRGRGGRG